MEEAHHRRGYATVEAAVGGGQPIGVKRFKEEFEREGVEAFAYMDHVFLGPMGITTNTIRASAFLRRGSKYIGIVVNTSKTVALPPKGHIPTAEEIALLESVDVRARQIEGNEGRDGRNGPRILVGMGSRRRGGRGPKPSRGRHAGRA